MSVPKTTYGKRVPPMVLPVVLIGAKVKGKVNYCTVAWATMIDDEPPKMAAVMAKDRRTKEGIIENGTFSINLPGPGSVVATDYCGLHSGHGTDKSQVFDVFFGKTLTAPMARECPVNVELTLDDIIEFEGTDMVVGEVEEVYVDEALMKQGHLDTALLTPLLYQSPGGPYLEKGKVVAEAFKVGRQLAPK